MYQISQKSLLRQYILATVLLGIVGFALVYNKILSPISVGGFLFMIISIFIGLNSRRFKDFKNRKLQITDDGLTLFSGDKHLKILWKDIIRVYTVGKRDKISMLTIKTKMGVINLSYFENLTDLNRELHKYLEKRKWKNARFFQVFN